MTSDGVPTGTFLLSIVLLTDDPGKSLKDIYIRAVSLAAHPQPVMMDGNCIYNLVGNFIGTAFFRKPIPSSAFAVGLSIILAPLSVKSLRVRAAPHERALNSGPKRFTSRSPGPMDQAPIFSLSGFAR